MGNNVKISHYGFLGCRYSAAILLWIALIFRLELLIYFVALVFLFSAVLGIDKAPTVMLFTFIFSKSKKKDEVNRTAFRIVHSIAFVFSAVCSLMLFLNFRYAWPAVFAFAVIKSVSAIGFCPAEKLYSCLSNGGCCTLTGKKSNSKSKR